MPVSGIAESRTDLCSRGQTGAGRSHRHRAYGVDQTSAQEINQHIFQNIFTSHAVLDVELFLLMAIPRAPETITSGAKKIILTDFL